MTLAWKKTISEQQSKYFVALIRNLKCFLKIILDDLGLKEELIKAAIHNILLHLWGILNVFNKIILDDLGLKENGSISVSGQLPTYSSLNSTTVNW